MDERSWHPGRIFEAWEEIHSALNEAMEALPLETLAFLAERASDRIISDAAANALHEGIDAVNPDELRRRFRKETDEVAQPQDGLHASALEDAAAYAFKENQIAIWDRSERPYAVAVYDFETKVRRPR